MIQLKSIQQTLPKRLDQLSLLTFIIGCCLFEVQPGLLWAAICSLTFVGIGYEKLVLIYDALVFPYVMNNSFWRLELWPIIEDVPEVKNLVTHAELFDCFCCLCPVCWRVEGVVIHGSVVLFVDYAYSTTLTTLFQTNHSHPGKWEMLRLRFGLLSLGLIKTKKKGFIEQQYAQKQFLYNIHSLGQQCDTRMQRGTVRHYNVATV